MSEEVQGKLPGFNFTPGPWDDLVSYADGLAPFEPDRRIVVIMSREGDIAYLSHLADTKETKSNSLLLSTAPDLLEACQAAEIAIRDCIRRPMGVEPESATHAVGLIARAIAKVRGEKTR